MTGGCNFCFCYRIAILSYSLSEGLIADTGLKTCFCVWCLVCRVWTGRGAPALENRNFCKKGYVENGGGGGSGIEEDLHKNLMNKCGRGHQKFDWMFFLSMKFSKLHECVYSVARCLGQSI